jgi:hypothetical protein
MIDIKSKVVDFQLLPNRPGPWAPSVTDRARELAIRLGDVLQEYGDLDETQLLSALVFVTVECADGAAADCGLGVDMHADYVYFELERQLQRLEQRWRAVSTSDVAVDGLGAVGERR